MPQPTAAMLVIGDEILTGRTREGNAHLLARRLDARALSLREIRVVPDARAVIVDAVRQLSDRHDHLFTSGGIGPTHDDITADAVAEAFGVPIDVRDDARAILEKHYGDELNEARLRMARIPEGATLIENPVSRAPGFSLRNVHVMAGVPAIFAAMLEGLLPRITGGERLLSHSFVMQVPEGDLAEPLRRLAAERPDIAIGCYPAYRGSGPSCRVVLRAEDRAALADAADEARRRFRTLTDRIEEEAPDD